MWFHRKFERRAGELEDARLEAVKLELGTDEEPTSEADHRRDCVLACARYDTNGFPVQRIAVGFRGPNELAKVRARLFVFDELSHAWFRIGDWQDLEHGAITTFDIVSLLERPEGAGTRSSVEALILVAPTMGALVEPGVYSFVLGPDTSNPGI